MTSPTFYIFHGDDELRISEEVEKMRARMGDTPEADLNISELDGEAVSPPEVIAAACAMPFLAERRMVIVRGMLAWLGRKGAGKSGKQALAQLSEALPTLPESTRLVFVERQKLANSNKVVQLAREHPAGYEKIYSTPKDSTGWIINRAKDGYGATIEGRAAAALASVTQGDLRRADNELAKLVGYVDGERPITEADVALLTPYVAEASIFDMVDALAEGRGQAALSLLHHLLDEGQDIFGLYGMVTRQFRLLLLAREYLDSGGSPGGIADALGIHRFVGQKLAVQSRGFNIGQLERIYRTLQENDLKMKTGRIEAGLALDLIIAGLAQ